MRNHLILRADATAQMGTGHVMRMLALAEAWSDTGGAATFVSCCASAPLRLRIEDAGYSFVAVECPYPDSADVTGLLRAAEAAKADAIVLDGYHFGSDYQHTVQNAGFRLAVVDDYGHVSEYHADFLINQNLYADGMHYTCPDSTRKLLGPRFAMLRREFAQRAPTQRTIPDRARHMLVTLGGSDPANETAKVVRAIQKLDDRELQTIVVAGPANPHIAELDASVSGGHSDITIEKSVSCMSALMEWADLVVSAGGTTCLELARMGAPNIILVLADNQRAVAESFDQAGISWNLGPACRLSEQAIEDSLRSVIMDKARRQIMSARGMAVVDGQGASRVAAALQGGDDVQRR